MPFCGTCGNQNPENNKFCSSCGGSIAGATTSGIVGVSRPSIRKSPETVAMACTILGVVGGGLLSLGWLLWSRSYFSGYRPSDASWVLWFLGGICWIVGLSLPWNLIGKFLGGAVQIVGFVSVCLMALAALIGFLSDSATPSILMGISFAGLTTAAALHFIPKVRGRTS